MQSKLSTFHRICSALVGAILILTALQPVTAQAGSVPAPAAQDDGLRRGRNPQTGLLTFLGADPGRPVQVAGAMRDGMPAEERAASILERFGPEFGIRDARQELRVERAGQPAAGRQMVRYQQMYQGVPVMAGELIVNTTAEGALLSISGKISPSLGLSTTPGISAEQAREAAYQLMSRDYGLDSARVSLSEPELWILDERLLKPSLRRAALAWRLEATVEGEAVRELVLVDAQSGNVSLHFNQVDGSWASRETPAEPARGRPAPQPVQGTEAGTLRYVAPGGADIGTCSSPASPCATINYAISQAVDTDTIQVAEGTYTGIGDQVVLLFNKDVNLSGGWDTSFTSQTGYSTLDGENARAGISMELSTSIVERFIVQHGYGYHAGIWISSGNVTINHSSVRDNFSGEGGGIANDGTLTLNDSSVRDNVSSGRGGGIFSRGTVTINDSEVLGNSSKFDGGGIYNWGILSVNRTVIAYNLAPGSEGGGVSNNNYQIEQSLWIIGSQIHHNKAGMGGGVSVYFGKAAIQDSFIYANEAENEGGGIRTVEKMTLANVTIANNFAIHGAGIHAQGTVSVNNSTIAGNRATWNGGGLYLNGTGLTLNNSIVAKNSAVNQGLDCYGRPTSKGYNLIGSTAGCTYSSAAGDKVNLDPRLGPFVPAVGIFPLSSGSPAINTGNPLTCRTTDQTGLPRLANGKCDMGAYEYRTAGAASRLVLVGGSGQQAMPTKAFRQPLQVVALDASDTPVPGVTVHFEAPAFSPSGKFADTHTNQTSAVTNSAGVAQPAAFTADSTRGSYEVIASSGGLAPVLLSLHNGPWMVKTPAEGGSNANDCLMPESACATLQGVMAKLTFNPGDVIWVAVGENDTGTLTQIRVTKNTSIVGGWDPLFDTQLGTSTIRDDIYIEARTIVSLRRLTIQNSTMEGLRNGVTNNGTLTIQDSTIRDNTWYGIGNLGTLTVINTTITQNGNDFDGGGIGNSAANQHPVSILSSTITRNRGSGGLYYFEGQRPIYLRNTIIADNFAQEAPIITPDCQGPIISGGYNIIGNIGNVQFPLCEGQWWSTDQVGYYRLNASGRMVENTIINPLLDSLVDLGNATWVHPLLHGSPAYDAGSPLPPGTPNSDACPVTDQRGMLRPQGQSCDIGAYEQVPERSTTSALFATYDAAHGKRLPGRLICDQTDPTCANGAAVPGAPSAHLHAKGTYDFYLSHHGRNSLDGQGLEINSTVRYASGYGNAFWNGQMLVYGDKYGFAQADDVVAHELTHGVTQYESGLFYYYQSGAISESFSDLWGEAYDQLNGSGNDSEAVKWMIGEDVTGLGAIRSMKNPLLFGDPDRMTSTKYYKGELDNGGVHTNSGINNKAVFLMAAGGSFNGRSIAPLGWPKVLAIYYEAQTNLLTSGSDYLDLHNALYQACLNKIGTASIKASDCLQVRYATLAVEMNKEPATGFNPDVPKLCPDGTSPYARLFSDDFETGTDGWILSKGWFLNKGYASSGEYMLYADDMLRRADASATTRSITLPAGSKAFLYFRHAFAFETGTIEGVFYNFDGGLLEYSVNNGPWRDAQALFKAGRNYAGLVSKYAGGGNPIAGRMAFVGASRGYVGSQYDLLTLAGKKVRFRWRMGTDYIGSRFGWVVDDVSVYTCIAIPSKPRLQVPANNARLTDYTPAFNWSDSTPKPHHYQVQVAADTAFKSLVINKNVAVSAVTPAADLAIGQAYYWRVRALNAAGGTAGWTTARVFKTIPIAPALLVPDDGVTLPDNRPAFDWSDVPGASDYTLQLAADAAFTAPVLLEVNVMDSTFTPDSDLPAGTLLYWRARANSPAGSSGWSAARSFQIASSGGAPGRSAEPPQAAPE